MSIEQMKQQLNDAYGIMMDAPYEATVEAWSQVDEAIAVAQNEDEWRPGLTTLKSTTLVAASGGTTMCGQAVREAEVRARGVLMDTVTQHGEALLEGLARTSSSAKLLWAAGIKVELGVGQLLDEDDAHKNRFIPVLRSQSEGIVVSARDLSRLVLSTEVLFQDCIRSL